MLGDLEELYGVRARRSGPWRAGLRTLRDLFGSAISGRGAFGHQALASELALAVRRFLRRPGRRLATALTLAVGIGATTAAFAAVDHVLLRELPVHEQEELVVAWRASERTSIHLPFSGLAFDAVRREAESLSGVAGYSAWGALPLLVETADDAYPLAGVYVAGDFFGVLGARPYLGRLLETADDAPGAAPTAVLSHSVWRTRYGADPTVVGSTLVINDQAFTVVGVAPRGFEYPMGTEIWYPMREEYGNPPESGPAPELHLLGRMAAGVDAATVIADLTATLDSDPRVRASIFEARNVVAGFEEKVVGPVTPVLQAAFIAALVLLLAAAANATLFLLAGGPSAAQEIAVMRALGAEPGSVIRRHLADSAVVGALAGVGGIALAYLGVATLVPLAPAGLPRFDAVQLDARAVGVAISATVALTLATGVVAGLIFSRLNVLDVLSSAGRGAVGAGSGFRTTVAGLQVSLAVVSAVGAGLLLRTVAALDSLEPGFSVEDMTVVGLQTPYTWFEVPEDYLLALERVVRDLEGRPGVISARPSLGPPLQQRLEVTLRAEGQSDADVRTNPTVAVDAVLPGHFEALGIPIRSGRGLRELDNRADADPVVVVDEALARALWPGEEPIGQRIIGYPGRNDLAFTVVGVVASTRYRDFLEVHPRAYYPLRLVGNSPPSALLVRTSEDIPGRDMLVEAFAAADPRIRVMSVERMTEVLREPTSGRRFAASVLVSFALATLLLAALGVYSVFTVFVLERTREMGVRRALGAGRSNIVSLVLTRIAKVAATGATLGLVVALGASRWIGSLLYGVDPTDPTTLTIVMLGILGLALCAGLVPALRAAVTDPMVSLRRE